MRLLHTSDWHLGRIFHSVHMTDDQAYVIDKLLYIIKDSKPDAIIVSGDVFDRSVPPVEAVNLLDDTLTKIMMDYKIPTIIISGNHDSPDRLGFGYRLMRNNNLYVFGRMDGNFEPVTIKDKFGPVNIYAVPYCEPVMVKDILKDENIHNHDDAMGGIINHIKSNMNKKERNVLAAHAFVTGCEVSESERPLSVGGSGEISASYFKDFNYTALGHLHKPQKVGCDSVRYSGSLMKYSFAETGHKNYAYMVEMAEDGAVAIEDIELKPKKELRCIEGYLDDIIKKPKDGENIEDYIMVTLKDDQPIMDPIGKLRKVYPNVLHIERPQFTSNEKILAPGSDFKKMSELSLFQSFFHQVMGREITGEQERIFQEIVDTYYKDSREA